MPTTVEPPELPQFTYEDAWTLGRDLTEQCAAKRLPVTISIVIGAQRVFHAALAGTSADNDSWVARKIEIVRRFNMSSMAVHERIALDHPDFHRTFALPESQFAAVGGAVPIVVHGTAVGVLAISGLDSGEDHQLAVKAIAALAAKSRSDHG